MSVYDQIPETNTVARLCGSVHPGFNRIARAYSVGVDGQVLYGTFIDSDDCPQWARDVAKYDRDKFVANARCITRAEEVIPASLQGMGTGQRAVHFQHAVNYSKKYFPSGRGIYQGAQSYSNCTSWCYRVIVGGCIIVDIIVKGEAHWIVARPGTASIYSNRGSRQDGGMSMSAGAQAVHEIGNTQEVDYPSLGIDLSTQAKDERAGVEWGRSGMPEELRELVRNDRIEQVSYVQEKQAVMDLLFGGHFIATGSTRTAGGNGDPISRIGRVGGHAQALIGYDDTDEFRDWYREKTGRRLTDGVFIFDQSWGANWITVTNWPEHLWGPYPEGAFVLEADDGMQLVNIWGEAIACSKVMGFPLLNLPDWGTHEYL